MKTCVDSRVQDSIQYSNDIALCIRSRGYDVYAITANTWTTVDVTSYITGNGAYNFTFTTTSNTNTSFSSREGANPPELVIVTSGGVTNTPTSASTLTPNAPLATGSAES